MLPRMVFGLLLLGLAGCAGTNIDNQPGFLIPQGTQIRVNQDLELRNGARASIQDGTVLQFSEVRIMRPYCQFKVLRPPEEMRDPLLIESGKFRVERSYRRFNFVAIDELKVAINFLDDENRTLSTVMEISSEAQPNVTVFVCARWGTRRLDGYLTLDEIRATLGDLVQLELP